jgi:hypothetical protein
VTVKKFKVSKPNARGWPFAAVIGLALGILVLMDDSSTDSACRMMVTGDVLSERANPDPSASSVTELHRGQVVDATTELNNGYRKLADGNWGLDTYLTPVPKSKCGSG